MNNHYTRKLNFEEKISIRAIGYYNMYLSYFQVDCISQTFRSMWF